MKSPLLFCVIACFFLFSKTQLASQQPFPTHFEPKGFGGGGYMYAPSISPHDPNHLFVGCDMGGTYRSQDGAQTWKMMHTDQFVNTVKGKVQFTSDPNILYAVRRSTTNLDDPLWRGELAKSTDGGTTWLAMPDPTGVGVHRLEVDPASTQRLILNEYNQLFFSANGGSSWASVFQPLDEQMWLGGVFWDDQNIYIGTNHGLLVSKNGGASFAIESHSGLPAGAGIYHLAGAKEGATTRLFCIPAPASEMYAWFEPLGFDGLRQGIFRMNYATNAAWENSRGNIPADIDIAWVDLAKNNTQIVWADGPAPGGFTMTWKSTDGGATWASVFQIADNQNISTGWAGAGGPYWLQQTSSALGFDVSDTNPNHVMRTRGEAEMTTDGGATWRSVYVLQNYLNPIGQPTAIDKFYKSSGLDVTTAHHLFWKNDTELFLANTDVGLTYSADAGDTWTFARNTFHPWGAASNNNWYRIVQRPDNQHLFAAVADVNDIYHGYRLLDWTTEWSGGLVLNSTDGGTTWDTLHNFGHPVVWLEIDKNNPAKIWASVVHHLEGGIFRSDDGGQTWTKLPAPPRTEGHPYNIVSLPGGGLVVTYSARALDDGAQTLTESSGVFFSPDGGNSWEDRTDPAMKFYTKDLAVDPHDPAENTWYATVWGRHTTWPGSNNQANGGLYRTTDRGQTWTRIFATPPADQTESISIHPAKPGTAYLAVENDGLFFTEDLGAATPTFERVSSYPWWRPKRVFFPPGNPCEVWVTSMGGGLWKGETDTPLSQVIVGAADACGDETMPYSILAVPGATYNWTVTGGEILSGQGTNSISVKWGAGGAGEVKVSYCTGEASMQVSIQPKATAAFSFSANGLTAAFSNTSTNASSFSWDFGDGSPASSEANPAHTFSVAGIYTVVLTATNDCGSVTLQQMISVQCPTLAVSISASGPTQICEGESVLLMASSGNFAAYQWYLDGAKIPGETAAGFAAAASGIYKIWVTDTAGCEGFSNEMTIEIAPVPTVQIQPSGTIMLNYGQSATLDAGAGFSSWIWSTGASTQQIVVSECGSYSVEVADMNGCTAASSAVLVVVAPVAVFSSGILISTPAAAYQWLLDGNPIPGATGQTVMPTVSGNYSVQVSCPPAGWVDSGPVAVMIVGIPELTAKQQLKIYPNPVAASETSVILEMAGFEKEAVSIVLTDLSGRVVFIKKMDVPAEKTVLEMRGMATGAYLVEVWQKGKMLGNGWLLRI
ncbi:MAG: PKD domain-containing protein [Saprospiraceae bacterium]